jgi:hypothetical protein
MTINVAAGVIIGGYVIAVSKFTLDYVRAGGGGGWVSVLLTGAIAGVAGWLIEHSDFWAK